MKIVIIGDGKVGFRLAKHLTEENHDVVLIDNNEQKLKETINKLDVICVTGDGASAEVQTEAGVPEADLVIACASRLLLSWTLSDQVYQTCFRHTPQDTPSQKA